MKRKNAALVKATNEKNQEILEDRLRGLRYAFAGVCGTPGGVEVLRHIRDICGYEHSSVYANAVSGDISIDSTVYNEARRGVYIEIRRLIPKKALIEIEFGDKK